MWISNYYSCFITFVCIDWIKPNIEWEKRQIQKSIFNLAASWRTWRVTHVFLVQKGFWNTTSSTRRIVLRNEITKINFVANNDNNNLAHSFSRRKDQEKCCNEELCSPNAESQLRAKGTSRIHFKCFSIAIRLICLLSYHARTRYE